MAPEKVFRDKRRLTLEQPGPHFAENRKTAVQIVVGEEIAGAPELEQREDQRGDGQVVAQQNLPAGPAKALASLCRFWRNHR